MFSKIKDTISDSIYLFKIEKYNSIGLASKWIFEQGLSKNIHSIKSSISCSIRGVYKSSFGFKWELDKDEDLDKFINKKFSEKP